MNHVIQCPYLVNRNHKNQFRNVVNINPRFHNQVDENSDLCTPHQSPSLSQFGCSDVVESREPGLFLFIWMGKRIALFVLPDPQTLGMLIDVDGIERLVNNV